MPSCVSWFDVGQQLRMVIVVIFQSVHSRFIDRVGGLWFDVGRQLHMVIVVIIPFYILTLVTELRIVV